MANLNFNLAYLASRTCSLEPTVLIQQNRLMFRLWDEDQTPCGDIVFTRDEYDEITAFCRKNGHEDFPDFDDQIDRARRLGNIVDLY